METILILFLSLLALIVILIIASMVLVKDTKQFRIRFSFFRGFDISGSFYEDKH